MEKTTAIVTTLILLLILNVQQQTLSQEFGKHADAVERTIRQEKERAHEVHCSRERSRAAWQVLDEYLMPFMEREKYQVSRKCRLHPDSDLFRDQEQHKIHVDINEWKCGYCKKSFRAEKYLDQHFESRHYNLLNVSDGKCLADLCGALHCDFVMKSKSPKTKCNPAAVAKNRHICESLADSCFPIHQGPSTSRLHELFLRQFCDAHTCSGKRKYFPKGGKKQTSVFYLAISILTLMLLPLFYLIVYLYQRCYFLVLENLTLTELYRHLHEFFPPSIYMQRNEAGNPRAEANFQSWTEDKTIIADWHILRGPPPDHQMSCKISEGSVEDLKLTNYL